MTRDEYLQRWPDATDGGNWTAHFLDPIKEERRKLLLVLADQRKVEHD